MSEGIGPKSLALLAGSAVLAACGVDAPSGASPDQPFTHVTCGGPPAFEAAVLDQGGTAERGDDAAAATLRAVLAETNGDIGDALPDTGWIEVTRTESRAKYLARGGEGPGFAIVTLAMRNGEWALDAPGRCELQPEVRAGLQLAMFRVAPGQELTPETRDVQVLVVELGCNSGEDARGRVRVDRILPGESSVTVVIGTVPREGSHDCQDNPETPFVLELPEPLGDRVLLDAYSIPPRDATECHPFAC